LKGKGGGKEGGGKGQKEETKRIKNQRESRIKENQEEETNRIKRQREQEGENGSEWRSGLRKERTFERETKG